MKKQGPEIDELVIARIKKIMPYGAFCELEEYGNKEAFIHISEVASRWVKNIHNFLKEGQRVVGRVHRIVPEKNMIDISLKRVTEIDKKRKLDIHRRQKRAEKLFEVIAEKVKKSGMPLNEVIMELEKKYGDVFTGLEEISVHGEEAFKNTKITDDWMKVIIDVARDNIKKKKKEIGGILTIKCLKPNGIALIKECLTSADANVTYISAPHYSISVEGEDFKKCEKKLKNAVDKIKDCIEKAEGTCSFEKREES
ncbi:MAG: translation initiation factor IF-2 subunit alpha [Candidatus Micrarchaeia archaeon]